jgi:hypothetical protein
MSAQYWMEVGRNALITGGLAVAIPATAMYLEEKDKTIEIIEKKTA